ncbi:MAG: hypothetical protein AAF721_33620 [Myxococcota bacterium]
MSVGIQWAQARRITCEHCSQPYTFVEGGTERADAGQSVAFADAAELRRTAFRDAANAVDEAAEIAERGRGHCPHCHQLQEWMRVSAATAIGGLLAVSAAVAGLAGYLAESAIAVAAVAGVGAVLSVVVGRKLADPPGPAAHRVDPLVKTDEQLIALIGQFADPTRDPLVQWWKTAAKPAVLNNKNLIEFSMGIWDQATQPLDVPYGLTTRARSAALNRADG